MPEVSIGIKLTVLQALSMSVTVVRAERLPSFSEGILGRGIKRVLCMLASCRTAFLTALRKEP